MKVGDYVRTEDGKIFKWNKLCTADKNDYEEHTRKILFDENKLKSSPNIIDLIEVGDYVNGVIVTQSYIDNIKHIAPEIKENNYGIKSIVTKEQFKNMEYEVK